MPLVVTWAHEENIRLRANGRNGAGQKIRLIVLQN